MAAAVSPRRIEEIIRASDCGKAEGVWNDFVWRNVFGVSA
jgi:hypothetical protein